MSQTTGGLVPKRPTHGSRAFLTGPLVGLTSVQTPVGRGQQQGKKEPFPLPWSWRPSGSPHLPDLTTGGRNHRPRPVRLSSTPCFQSLPPQQPVKAPRVIGFPFSRFHLPGSSHGFRTLGSLRLPASDLLPGACDPPCLWSPH